MEDIALYPQSLSPTPYPLLPSPYRCNPSFNHGGLQTATFQHPRLAPYLMLARLALLLAVLVAGCAAPLPPASPEAPAAPIEPTVILVSIDGLRYDYLDRVETPTLDRLAAEGVHVERLIAAFPTLTFPNHYSIVTGLHPERHGIISNTMRDDELGFFSLGTRDAISDGRWWEGEPIWVTAERQGQRAATLFWPGSEAEIAGYRPSTWLEYDGRLAHEARIDSVLTWLDRPDETRPTLITLYFSSVDSEGHRHGPDAPEVDAALEEVDARLGDLLTGLEARGLAEHVHLLITTDHGMAALDPERVVFFDDYFDFDAEVASVTWGAVTGLWPVEGREQAILDALADADHLSAWPRAEVPERFHYRDHHRIPPIVVMADEGWTLSTRVNTEQRGRPSGGTHGFDPELDSMHGTMIVTGPRFRRGETVARMHAVDLYGVMTEILGLEPAEHQGDPAAPARLLRD